MLKELVSNMPSVSHNVNNLSDILSYKILVGINFIIQNYALYLYQICKGNENCIT